MTVFSDSLNVKSNSDTLTVELVSVFYSESKGLGLKDCEVLRKPLISEGTQATKSSICIKNKSIKRVACRGMDWDLSRDDSCLWADEMMLPSCSVIVFVQAWLFFSFLVLCVYLHV